MVLADCTVVYRPCTYNQVCLFFFFLVLICLITYSWIIFFFNCVFIFQAIWYDKHMLSMIGRFHKSLFFIHFSWKYAIILSILLPPTQKLICMPCLLTNCLKILVLHNFWNCGCALFEYGFSYMSLIFDTTLFNYQPGQNFEKCISLLNVLLSIISYWRS